MIGPEVHYVLESPRGTRKDSLSSKNANRMKKLLPWFGLVLCLAGCSTFQSDWKSATAQPAPAVDMTGPWEGQWKSDVNGHEGRLRCLVSRNDDQTYEARFHAKYRRILGFKYTVNLSVESDRDQQVVFEGEADLGWYAGGLYRYDGHADPTAFFSTYKSKADAGVFKMNRP